MRSGGIPFKFPSPLSGLITPPISYRQTPPVIPVRDPARDITNLSKLYSEDKKYSGQSDNFDFYLTVFNNYCS
jgi:hypothetical protein